jgi:hypothetical protein
MVLAATAVVLIVADRNQTPAVAQEVLCPEGSLPFPDGGCGPVVDRSGEYVLESPTPERTGPSLTETLLGIASDSEPTGGASVVYKHGHLDPNEGAELVTSMAVYPKGLGVDLGDRLLYTTATNRWWKSLEIVGMYTGTGAWLGIWDFSCSMQYPCANPANPTGGWQIVRPIEDWGCYIGKMTNSAYTHGDWHAILWYRNKSEKLDQGNPALWRNSALFVNHCTYTWDIVYTHEYRAGRCDLYPNRPDPLCGWWGPFTELPRGDISAPISKLAFGNTSLYLTKEGEPDGPLTPDHTDFWDAKWLWREVGYLEPNHTWGRGTYLDSDADGVWDFQDPDDDQDGYTDLDESGAPLCIGSRNDDGSVDAGEAAVNDGCPAVGTAETVCGAAYDEDGDGYVNDGCPVVGVWREGQFKIGTMSLGRCSYITTAPSRVWPSDLAFGGVPNSTGRITLTDITSFVAPTWARKLNTSPGDTNFNSRWDLLPGRGVFSTWININDLTAIIAGPTGYPPMLNGQKAYGSRCPW